MAQWHSDLIRKTVRMLRSDVRAIMRLAERPGVEIVSRDELEAEAKVRSDLIAELSKMAQALEPSQSYKNWERGQAAATVNLKPMEVAAGSKPFL